MTTVGYLGGLGRSGTTLIERILGQLPDVCPLGEVVHLWRRGVIADEACGCGQPFSECPFWTAVGAKAFGGWDQVDLDAVFALTAELDRTRRIPVVAVARSSSRTGRHAHELAEYYGKIYAAAGEISGARVLIDSSKHPSTAVILARHSEIDLRIAHVVRDSRGVAYSWTKQVRRPEGTSETDGEFMTRYSPSRAALLWDSHNLTLSALARFAPTQRVRYEDVVDDPAGTITRLCGFLGLPSDAVASVLSGDSAQLAPGHSVSGNPMRFQAGRISLKRDDAWRTAMPRRAKVSVSVLTSPLLLRFGYLTSRKSSQ